jgi:hypothetical protein
MRSFIPSAAAAALLAGALACVQFNPTPLPDPCAEAATDERGNLILGPDFADGDTTTEYVNTVTPVHTAHPEFDTSTEQWYGVWLADPTACPTLGGMIPPPEAADIPGVQDEMALNAKLDSVGPALAALPPPPLPAMDPIPVPGDTLCPAPLCDIDPTGSFGGRDIIYVHGLRPGVMRNVIAGSTVSAWPLDAPDFLLPGGYWRLGAAAYWKTHVQNLLVPRGMRNRVLYVGWSPMQPLEVAAHTVLTQIAHAMSYGTAVVVRDPADPRGDKYFCVPECVVISHSTGAPVTDVALALANNPALASDPNLQGAFANAGFIPAHVRVHVALGGTFSGAQYATAALALATLNGSDPELCPLAMALLEIPQGGPCPNFTPLSSSILRDLHPPAMQGKWGPVIAATPVPVLAIAGGHPDENWPFKRFAADGFDDGVITMDGACARTTPVHAWPSGYVPYALKRVFDLGIPFGRAVRYWGDQRFEAAMSNVQLPRVAAACTPWKSPTGMVQPVAALTPGVIDPLAFIPQHFAFVQSAESHTTGLLDCGERPAEESRAIYSPFVYTLVSGAMGTLQDEEVRGRPIGKRRRWWLWKRTYHLLQGWQQQCAADYAYDYVLR